MTQPPIYRLAAYGAPAPKGSMVCIGQRGPVKHQVIESDTAGHRGRWRAELTAAIEDLTAHIGGSLAGPVIVGLVVYIEQAPSNRDPLPIGRNTGDVDKHTRMTLDALTDGNAITDDSRVTLVLGAKTWAHQRPPGATVYLAHARPGAALRILAAMLREAPELELDAPTDTDKETPSDGLVQGR